MLLLTQYKRADSAEDREAIYELRYRAYLREGAIKPSAVKSFSDEYDSMPNAWIFGVHIDERLVSSFRMHVSTPEYPDIPAAHVFPDILNPLIESGKIIIDPTRFVADDAATRQYPELAFVTVRLAALATEYFMADYVLATVRAEHQAFYRRVFGHRVVCPPRPYPTLEKPISLLMVDHRTERDTIARRYPFFQSTPAERAALFDRPARAKQRTAA
ncbi:MAG: hypothetical protein IT539_11115 [Bradyrhizobiaceae bacterium]|nr:hypothetical protein [Bradyrhizobiaceae bacterium]